MKDKTKHSIFSSIIGMDFINYVRKIKSQNELGLLRNKR